MFRSLKHRLNEVCSRISSKQVRTRGTAAVHAWWCPGGAGRQRPTRGRPRLPPDLPAACSRQAVGSRPRVDEEHGPKAGDEGEQDEQVARVGAGPPPPPDAPPHLQGAEEGRRGGTSAHCAAVFAVCGHRGLATRCAGTESQESSAGRRGQWKGAVEKRAGGCCCTCSTAGLIGLPLARSLQGGRQRGVRASEHRAEHRADGHTGRSSSARARGVPQSARVRGTLQAQPLLLPSLCAIPLACGTPPPAGVRLLPCISNAPLRTQAPPGPHPAAHLVVTGREPWKSEGKTRFMVRCSEPCRLAYLCEASESTSSLRVCVCGVCGYV